VSYPNHYLRFLQHKPIVIGTKHQKDRVITPPLASRLGLQPFLPAHFDTDCFGTFTGEIPRTDSPQDTLRKKCRAAMDITGCSLGIASEGSFGPHPGIPFLPANDELLIFLDDVHGYEIIVHERSADTNFNARPISSWHDLAAFAECIDFPTHGIILRAGNILLKDIQDWDTLRDAYATFSQTEQPISAETDMRAMHNPRRMQVIAQATNKLVEQILSLCPDCGAPGFVVRQREPGLPCGQCGLPTPSALRAIKTCIACDARVILEYPDGKTREDPGRCAWCNP
jgi:ribosomal protein S27AE